MSKAATGWNPEIRPQYQGVLQTLPLFFFFFTGKKIHLTPINKSVARRPTLSVLYRDPVSRKGW